MASAARAAAVPRPGMATRISHKGQRSAKIKLYKNNNRKCWFPFLITDFIFDLQAFMLLYVHGGGMTY